MRVRMDSQPSGSTAARSTVCTARKCRLCGCETRDRHAVGRAGNIGEAHFLAEGDGGRVAAMLAAYAELDVGAHFSSPPCTDGHQFAHAIAVQRNEGILRDDLLAHIVIHEVGGVVTADAESCLR